MITDYLGKQLLFLDGGMGTLLQEKGLKMGELPEIWNITNAQAIIDVHKSYFEAGSNIVLTNTFGANSLHYKNSQFSVNDIIKAAVQNAKEAAKQSIQDGKERFVALDIGPSGKLLKPLGDLDFEDAYRLFKEMVISGAAAGADLIHIETMSDTYEMKAAILAAKENSTLPVFATMVFDENQKLLTGGSVQAAVALMESLRVDALGVNCGLGPDQMPSILEELLKYSSLPIIVKPNAGLPKTKDGVTYFDVAPEEFAVSMKKLAQTGAVIIGGCCGTTPEHIRKTVQLCKGVSPVPVVKKDFTVVSSYSKAVLLGTDPVIIGERINPTGKPKFKVALKENNLDYILKEALNQQDNGAHILDVNVGLPEIDEPEMMKKVVTEIQSITDLPLQIDTSDVTAMESAMRIYNGKPLINSVNGKVSSMEAIFSLIKKYGGAVVGLTLDDDGIPETAEGRLKVAEKIVSTAASYGIPKKDIIIDVLTMTVSSEPMGAKTTLDALRLVKEKLGVKTILGVSNISFGLPARPIINSHFYTLALQSGLDAAIVNPGSAEMMQSYRSFCALMAFDTNCSNYINAYSEQTSAPAASSNIELSLKDCIEKGLKEDARTKAKLLLKSIKPLEIIGGELIPALDTVGRGFEKGTLFLPQLLMSAEAAKAAFEEIKSILSYQDGESVKKDTIVLATVKGDIHDIGKNIVKVLLENYGYHIIDLGKDVPPEAVKQAVLAHEVRLVGLSALMTTTVTSMGQTIKLLRSSAPGCKIMVGGAVLTKEYAEMIEADFYAKDAMQAVHIAKEIFNI